MAYISLEHFIEEKIRSAMQQVKASPLNLGGISWSGGGAGQPPGGFFGVLPQTRVAFDLTEDETNYVPASGASLLDNLNRIRYRIRQLELGGGGGSSTFVNLIDTPNTYAGSAGKFVRVKDTEDGLEFATISSGVGGGHIIKDETTEYPQRTYLEFRNAEVTDDSVNDSTVVTIPSGHNHVYNEEFTGDGETTFTTAYDYQPGTLAVYLNGLRLPTTEFFENPPRGFSTAYPINPGDVLSVDYQLGGGNSGGGSGSGIYVPDFSIWVPDAPPQNPHQMNDEFDDLTLDQKWEIYDLDSVLNYQEREDGLALWCSQGDRFAGIFQPLSVTSDITFYWKAGMMSVNDGDAKVGLALIQNVNELFDSDILVFVLATGGFRYGFQVEWYGDYSSSSHISTIFNETFNGAGEYGTYFRLILPSSTTYDFQSSYDGMSWQRLYTGIIPFTFNGVGLVHKTTPEANATGLIRFFRVQTSTDQRDYLRGRRVGLKAF